MLSELDTEVISGNHLHYASTCVAKSPKAEGYTGIRLFVKEIIKQCTGNFTYKTSKQNKDTVGLEPTLSESEPEVITTYTTRPRAMTKH